MTASPVHVTLASQIELSDDVLVQEIDGEAILLDLAGERYFGLDPVGTRIWQLAAELPALRAVHARLCEEFDADPARIEADLIDLVGRLDAAGLVKIG